MLVLLLSCFTAGKIQVQSSEAICLRSHSQYIWNVNSNPASQMPKLVLHSPSLSVLPALNSWSLVEAVEPWTLWESESLNYPSELTSFVTLGKSFNFSRPQFRHLKNGNGNTSKSNAWGYQGNEMTMHVSPRNGENH